MEHSIERELDRERDFRRRVRRVYYKREDDFATLREYNDYLEEVEDIITALMGDHTRAEAQKRLDALSAESKDVTARNRAKLQGEKDALRDAVAAQAQEAQRLAEARQQAEQRAAEEQRAQKQQMQAQIAEGSKSAASAQAELALRYQEAAAAASAAAQQQQKQLQQAAGAASGHRYVPSAQAVERAAAAAAGGGAAALAQPLQPQADAEQQRPKFMQPARLAAKEEYENDPTRLHGARMAAGYRLDLWTYRYRQEAFDPGALIFGAS